jgi:hypothetical protein
MPLRLRKSSLTEPTRPEADRRRAFRGPIVRDLLHISRRSIDRIEPELPKGGPPRGWDSRAMSLLRATRRPGLKARAGFCLFVDSRLL